jgi:uncharacterized protein (DUF983 family)
VRGPAPETPDAAHATDRLIARGHGHDGAVPNDGERSAPTTTDTVPDGPARLPAVAPAGTMFWRGLIKHCPVCGSGHLFTRYFSMKPRCPGCNLRFARIEGSWTGDLGINTIVTFGLMLLAFIGGTLIMWNRLNVAVLASIVAAIAVFVPILFFPFTKTIWLAIDVILRPIEADELVP